MDKGEGKWYVELTIIGEPGTEVSYMFDGGEQKSTQLKGGGSLRVKSETVEESNIISIDFEVSDGTTTINGTVLRPW